MGEQVINTEYSEVMQTSFINYAMSVITARALPDVRDGLKPVQRRVLYAMHELGLNYDKPHRKSARIVGDTMGKFHPHGDSSIYEALVVMEQDFKKGMALVDGHGNFGSIEGDGAAAMRYTEARLKKFTQDVYLRDLDKNIVNFVPNFDETEKEPEVLPVRVPNILINGSDGIAVGMVTSIPPHNLSEVIDAVCAYIDNNDITTEELMKYIPGPDFPTGGTVINKSELKEIYETGSGKIRIRGKVEVERGKHKNDKDRIVISEIPYTIIGSNLPKLLSDIAELAESRKTTDIVDISNESSKDGMRIVIELKKNADADKIINLLYKKTKLEDTFGVNMLAIADGKPERLSLRDILSYNLDFQIEIFSRKYNYLLEKETEKKEVREGLIKAYDVLDLIIEIIRGSRLVKEVRQCLTTGNTEGIKFKSKASENAAKKLRFTERQAAAILELRLQKLVGLELEALEKEYAEIIKNIAEYTDILENHSSMLKVIKKELIKIKKEFSLPRRTLIENGAEAVYEEEPVEEQEVVFLMDRFGYSKTLDVAAYERNKETVDAENRYVFKCMNTDKIWIFTDIGNMHQLKVMDIPAGKPKDKGQPIDNLCNYSSREENLVAIFACGTLKDKKLLFISSDGMMKKVSASEFETSRKTVAATKLNDGARVIFIAEAAPESKIKAEQDTLSGESAFEGMPETENDREIIVVTKNGFFLRFAEEEIPEKKKTAVGVRGIKLENEDAVDAGYLVEKRNNGTFTYKNRGIAVTRIKLTKRDGKGSKLRL